MANLLQQAGAGSDPTAFAPLFTNRIFTGLWTNRSALRDAATNSYQEKYGMGRQDSILDGFNSELSPRLTLIRRPGSSVYNANTVPRVKRFYSFNTFTLTDENIRVMADTAGAVLDLTDGGYSTIWNKSPGAGSTYFLGVGNILYMTNGIENKQWDYVNNAVTNWGIAAPTVAPTAVPAPILSRGMWFANTVYSRNSQTTQVTIVDPNGYIQNLTQFGTTGGSIPAFNSQPYAGTQDGTVNWQNRGIGSWTPNTAKQADDLIYRQSTQDLQFYFYQAKNSGTTGGSEPQWLNTIGSVVTDNTQTWMNIGRIMYWDQIGPSTPIIGVNTIIDSNNNIQTVVSPGKSGSSTPAFSGISGALTPDPSPLAWGSIEWRNMGLIAEVQYGYAYMNSKTNDISNMSPASAIFKGNDGEVVNVSGPGSTDPQVDTIIIYRTLHGGSTFLYAGQVANPGGGNWNFTDNVLDADLNTEWQAQRTGEGTPLPIGATCLGYHLGRIFAAVGNVVYISSGPDAVVGGSSGNAGFDTTFTVQSKITRFWACPLGMVVLTVRDAYIILGSATDTDPLYIVVWVQDLPLRSYDCFAVNKTSPYMLLGNNMLVVLDPSAGITEAGFPIADRLLEEFDSSASYVTYHTQSSNDSAIYVANGIDHWYRLNMINAPESGSAWSPRAEFGDLGCVQSVEISPGQYRLLMSGTDAGPILQRDTLWNTDNGEEFDAMTRFGSVVLAVPGQLAALSFITLESVRIGSRPALSLLLGELDGEFEVLKRTRQDPTNLPPSETIYSDRYHFEQNQETAWCRHFQMQVSWPPEDVPNELLTFTIFGQTWQEMRAQ